LLPDTILTKLAARAQIQTLIDIKEELPKWIWADKYGEVVLKLLEPIDRSWHEENERTKAANKAKHVKVSVDNKAIRDEACLAKAQEIASQCRALMSRPALQQVYPVPNPSQPVYQVPNLSQQVYPVLSHQNELQPTMGMAYYPIQYYPYPMQYALVPSYPPLSFIPYHPPT
jgi:hypothetical protein